MNVMQQAWKDYRITYRGYPFNRRQFATCLRLAWVATRPYIEIPSVDVDMHRTSRDLAGYKGKYLY